MLSNCSLHEDLPVAHFSAPTDLWRRTCALLKSVEFFSENLIRGLYLGYILRAFEVLLSQINEDISKKPDFASN